MYDGLGILEFVPAPHYKSDHPESHLVDKVVEIFEEKKIKYKPLKDGEVIVVDRKIEREWCYEKRRIKISWTVIRI